MMTQMTTPHPGAATESYESALTFASRRADYRLPSPWLDLAFAIVAGLLYALLVLGPRPLNPSNVNWVAFDPA